MTDNAIRLLIVLLAPLALIVFILYHAGIGVKECFEECISAWKHPQDTRFGKNG